MLLHRQVKVSVCCVEHSELFLSVTLIYWLSVVLNDIHNWGVCHHGVTYLCFNINLRGIFLVTKKSDKRDLYLCNIGFQVIYWFSLYVIIWERWKRHYYQCWRTEWRNGAVWSWFQLGYKLKVKIWKVKIEY